MTDTALTEAVREKVGKGRYSFVLESLGKKSLGIWIWNKGRRHFRQTVLAIAQIGRSTVYACDMQKMWRRELIVTG